VPQCGGGGGPLGAVAWGRDMNQSGRESGREER
jgi:hypothetical protein